MIDTEQSASLQDGRRNLRDRVTETDGRVELRISLSRWRGRDFVYLRIWYRDDSGIMRPSKSGFTLKAKALPDLQDVIANAMKTARAEGLL